MTFLSSKKTAIGCKWMFKYKNETVLIIDQNLANDNNQSQAARWRGERKQMKIQMCYKACLVVKDFKQQYEVDFWTIFSPTFRIIMFRMLVALAVYFN